MFKDPIYSRLQSRTQHSGACPRHNRGAHTRPLLTGLNKGRAALHASAPEHIGLGRGLGFRARTSWKEIQCPPSAHSLHRIHRATDPKGIPFWKFDALCLVQALAALAPKVLPLEDSQRIRWNHPGVHLSLCFVTRSTPDHSPFAFRARPALPPPAHSAPAAVGPAPPPAPAHPRSPPHQRRLFGSHPKASPVWMKQKESTKKGILTSKLLNGVPTGALRPRATTMRVEFMDTTTFLGCFQGHSTAKGHEVVRLAAQQVSTC